MATSGMALASGTFTCKTITGHKGDVNWCAFSPLQPQLVTASGDKTIRVWDIAKDTPTELKVLKGHKYYVNCAVFSPLGDILATGSSDFSVKLWSTETFTEIATLQTQGNVKCCSFTLDGSILSAASADNFVYVWEVSSLRLLKKLKKHDQSVLTCAFAPCGWMLATGDSGGELIIWDIHAGAALYCKTIHDMGVNCLLFFITRDPGQGQHTMISAGSDCNITIWSISSNARVHGSYRVTVVKERSLTGHTRSVCNCSLSLDNKLLASVSNDKTVHIWSMETFTVLRVFSAHDRFITCCCLSVDNKLLVTSSTDYTAKLWQLTEEQANTGSSQQLAPSAPPLESSTTTDTVNPPPWESQVLQWLNDVVSRQQQKQIAGTTQHQYDLSLVAKMASLSNQISTEISGQQDFCCPITQLRMVDPVVAADGYTYERSAIVSWLSEGRSTSPMTNLPFPHTNLVPNKTLKNYMDSHYS